MWRQETSSPVEDESRERRKVNGVGQVRRQDGKKIGY